MNTEKRQTTGFLATVRSYNNRHPVWHWFIGVLVVCLLAGFLYGTGAKALGAGGTAPRMCTHTNVDGACWFGPTESAKKFRGGYFNRTHGFPARQVFQAPRAARSFFVNKLSTRISHVSRAHRARIAWHFFGNTRNRTGNQSADACTSSTFCYGCSDYCLAWKMYGQLMQNAGCVGSGRPTTDPAVCQSGTHASITKKGVQRGGALVICGAAVVIGVLTAPESAGTSTVAAAGITGGVGCGWSFWSSFG